MRVLVVVLLGCTLLLAATSSDEDAHGFRVADDAKTPVVAEKENALQFHRVADRGLIEKEGCDDHQRGEQWGSSDQYNCICGGADRLCYRVDCLPGSETDRDSNGLWNCYVDFNKSDIPGSAERVFDREKRMSGVDAFGVFTGVLGIVDFIISRKEAQETTAQLNEIQGQIRALDRKVDDLTQSVSDLKLGQDYLEQVILHGKTELRLRNMLDTLANMQIGDDGQYIGSDVEAWADSVVSFDSDGIKQVLFNMLDMVNPQSKVFNGKSLFEIYHQQYREGDLEKYSEKMPKKVSQVYGLVGGGYALWIAALRIKGRTGDIPAKVQEGKRELSSVRKSLEKFVTFGTCPSGYRLKNRKCYKAFSIPKSWSEASEYCRTQGHGGKLAMPKDSDTNNFLIELKNAESTTSGFWFGLNDRDSEGHWRWNDGTSLGSFKYWAQNEPNNRWGRNWYGKPLGNEDCAVYIQKIWKNEWNDDHCKFEKYFICETMPYGVELFRSDFRCGKNHLTVDGYLAECNPTGTNPCCSNYGWCDVGPDHCDCDGCTDYSLKGVNVALDTTSFQTSISSGGVASRAVDGNTDTNWVAGSCTHTAEEANPSWRVDLGQSYVIDRVVIFNRRDCCSERISPFNIHIGYSDQVSANTKCGGDHQFAVNQPSMSVACRGLRGRYVGVRLPGPSRILTLCEVQVFATPASIRLVGGTSVSEGRVEVFHDKEWGTVCDDKFDVNDANVVCRQLGYDGATEARKKSAFGRGSGRIWLDELACGGSETTIDDCGHSGWGKHDCAHNEDAGVVCDDRRP
ncbi:SSC5D [Branchiostoma lanceolatum]|uniref:SSC5D protein n=1 Tax=Branchiostoma lanceolatum TaxID=7740 RepID=A0A8J9YNP6_BRALA|nr:SSC5D [Branchiostoma lanceolatum]